MKQPILILLLILAAFALLPAQVMEVSVTLNSEYLPADEQDDLAELSNKIERYFNGYTWIEDEFGYDFEGSIHIILENVQKKRSEKMYKAQFLISTSSGENFYDKSWEFTYEKSFPLSHSKVQFDPLTHFLDFYAYMVLAGELDTNGLLLGNPLYDKAEDIANQGLLSRYARGWNVRMDEVQKIMNIRTRPLREVKPDFFEALGFYDEDNLKEAYKKAKIVLEGIAKTYDKQPNNRYLQYFFNAHFNELAQLFAGRNEELEQLIKFDSKHRETYRNVKERD